MSYVEPENVRARATQMSLTALSDPDLEALIEEASRFFDLVCGVEPGYFEPAAAEAAATTRTFYGDGTNYLKADPYLPGTLVGTLTVPSGYSAPDFVESDGYLVFTNSDHVLPRTSSRFSSFGWWQGVPITLTAIWGFTATPADVQAAIKELVINLWRETDPAQIKLINIEGQPLREKLPPRVEDIARRYRMKHAVAFV